MISANFFETFPLYKKCSYVADTNELKYNIPPINTDLLVM